MGRKNLVVEVDGDGAPGGAAGFAASLLLGLGLSPFRAGIGLENLAVLFLVLVAAAAAVGGRTSRRAGAAAREEASAIRMLNVVGLAAAEGGEADQVAARELLDLLGARAISVVRVGGEGDWVSAHAGEAHDRLDPAALPRLDQEGRVPPAHLRAVGGMLMLPAGGVAVDLVHHGRRVGSLVIEPEVDRPQLRSTRMAVAAVAHILALGGERVDRSVG
jgi:hypothetical protein